MKKVSVRPLPNLVVDDFVANNDLFTLFDSVPANVIFLDNFVSNIVSFKDVFKRLNMRENIFFSCKANKSNALLQMAAEQQCGIEVSSYYELMDALKYTNKIIASGPAKEKYYLDCAVENNILISVDDIEELKSIKKLNKSARVILRISDLLGIISRFGINLSQIDESIKIIKESKIQLVGFSFHINNYNLEDRVNAVLQVLEIIKLKKLNVQYIDIGGGLPINYCTKEEFYVFLKENHEKMYFKNKMINEFYPYYSELASYKALEYILRKLKSKLGKIEIIIEPGRSLLNNCGISIYEVKYLKHLSNGDALIISNGNINCLSEQWFNSDYLIEPILYKKRSNDVSKENIEASVAGNLCLEQDIITWRKIRFENTPEEGDYLIYYNTAGYQMDSNESNFHKLPLVEKYIVKKSGKKYEVRKDYLYDSKKNNRFNWRNTNVKTEYGK